MPTSNPRLTRFPLALRLCLLAVLWHVATAAWAAELRVEVRGVSGEIRSTILSNLSLEREREHPLLGEYRIELLHRRAPEEIRAALAPFGYYEPEINGSLTRDGDVWRAVYDVTPGRPVRVALVTLLIEGPGENDVAFARWRAEFPLREGDILLHQVYESARDDLVRLGRERGYLEAELVTREVRVNAAEASAEIEIRYATGPRYRFGLVQFEGEVPLSEEFLSRFPEFHRGDYYDADKIFRLHRDLANSDYFEHIEVVPRTDAPEEQRIPVEVALAMRKRDRYTMGLGYGTDTGPRVTTGAQRRWANEDGHRFGGELLASEIRIRGSVYYIVPLDRPNTDSLSFNASRELEDTGTSRSDISSVGAALTHLIADNWVRTGAITYETNDYEVADVSDTSRILYPSVAFQRVEADDRLFPLHGWRLIAETRAATEEIFSSTSLLQGRLSGKLVESLLGGRVLARFDVAASYTTEFDRLPPTLRFFAGGDHSVRGFGYQTLGPTNEVDEVEGGQHLLVGSAEYDYYIGERWGVAAFTDVGNAFNSFGDYELHRGAGFGFRVRLPFGIIRLDAASAVSEPGQPWRAHLSIGPDL